jgi:hypothetical protein
VAELSPAEVAEAARAAAAEQQAAADAQAARAGGLRIEGFPAADAATRGGLYVYARDAEEPTANGFAHFVHAGGEFHTKTAPRALLEREGARSPQRSAHRLGYGTFAA